MSYIGYDKLDAMPPATAKAIRSSAYLHDGRGLRIKDERLQEILAGVVLTPGQQSSIELDGLLHTYHSSPLLGDRIEAWAKRHGFERAAETWEKWTGIPCGCKWRQNVINRIDGLWRSWRGASKNGEMAHAG